MNTPLFKHNVLYSVKIFFKTDIEVTNPKALMTDKPLMVSEKCEKIGDLVTLSILWSSLNIIIIITIEFFMSKKLHLSGLPPGNDKIRGTLSSTAETF